MGGSGSGNWYRWQSKKSTVEDSLTLSMATFRKRIIHGESGTLTWTWTSGRKSSVSYLMRWDNAAPALHVYYRLGGSENIVFSVGLEVTPTQFGGQRWWFNCPLMVNGSPCNRRVGKLHLPLGAKYFGCRQCHKLTYRSSQEAHQTERVFGRLGIDPSLARLFSNRNLSK